VPIAPEIFSCLHRTGWHAHGLQEAHGLMRGALSGPGTDQSVQGIVLAPAVGSSGKPEIVYQGWPASDLG
jgi:hypothetical protein